MTIDDSIKTATSGVALVGEIIKSAGDNPNVKEAGQNLGQTALTITKTINNALLPLAAINFAFDKARVYFAEKFQQDISQKVSAITPEQIIEPKASIAGPALQGLAFTHEEANLIRGVLQSAKPIAIVEVHLTISDEKSWLILATHLLNLRNSENSSPVENPKMPAMVDKWARLGLVDVDYAKQLKADDLYAWVENRPEVAKYRQEHESDNQKLTFVKGSIVRTALGTEFAKAVGLA